MSVVIKAKGHAVADSEKEARSWADAYRFKNYGYDPSTRISVSMSDPEKWDIWFSMASSCD